jgi:hypothetical protein
MSAKRMDQNELGSQAKKAAAMGTHAHKFLNSIVRPCGVACHWTPRTAGRYGISLKSLL